MTYAPPFPMTYAPPDIEDFTPGRASTRGDGTLWPLLLSNDTAIFDDYSPGFEANVDPSFSALEREYRFRMRGNLNDCDIQVDVRAAAVSGPHDIDIATGGTTTVNVTTDDWYGAAVSATGPTQNVVVNVPAVMSGSVQVQSIRAHLDVDAAMTGELYASGWRLIAPDWADANQPISTGILSRLYRNMVAVAQDRPVCVAVRMTDVVASVSGKSDALWGIEDLDAWRSLGRMRVPRCDDLVRTYTIDVYTVGSDAGEEYSVRIGGVDETWTASDTAEWHSWEVRLGPGPHDLQASAYPGTSNQASIRTVQVWRHKA